MLPCPPPPEQWHLDNREVRGRRAGVHLASRQSPGPDALHPSSHEGQTVRPRSWRRCRSSQVPLGVATGYGSRTALRDPRQPGCQPQTFYHAEPRAGASARRSDPVSLLLAPVPAISGSPANDRWSSGSHTSFRARRQRDYCEKNCRYLDTRQICAKITASMPDPDGGSRAPIRWSQRRWPTIR